jgi:hypothetical protein
MGGVPRRKEQGIERWSAPELGTIRAHIHVREILVVGNRLKRMVGWNAPESVTNLAQTLGRYSITRSARWNSDGGIVRQRGLAVLRLMTSSNLVGCSRADRLAWHL